jgi:quinol monooxygenase YgiN
MKQSAKITLLAELHPLPGCEQEVVDAAKTIWRATRQEAGCEAFVLTTFQEKGNTILFFEVFTSQAAFDEHRAAAHTVAFLSFVFGKVKGDGPALTFLNQLEE